jgi:hypothetical protein
MLIASKFSTMWLKPLEYCVTDVKLVCEMSACVQYLSLNRRPEESYFPNAPHGPDLSAWLAQRQATSMSPCRLSPERCGRSRSTCLDCPNHSLQMPPSCALVFWNCEQSALHDLHSTVYTLVGNRSTYCRLVAIVVLDADMFVSFDDEEER